MIVSLWACNIMNCFGTIPNFYQHSFREEQPAFKIAFKFLGLEFIDVQYS